MTGTIFTLLTDFGLTDSYVAQMKGVLLSRCKDCTIVDVTHQVPPQNIRRGSQLIAQYVPQFPRSTIHIAVVDPGVGTDRSILVVEALGQRLVLPDNGLITALWKIDSSARAWRVENTTIYNASSISSTFHGRDILAPIAAFLAHGGPSEQVGSICQRPAMLSPVAEPEKDPNGSWLFSISAIDYFGNVQLEAGTHLQRMLGKKYLAVELLDCQIKAPVVGTYGNATQGQVIFLQDSQRRLELAVVGGSAAGQFGLLENSKIRLWLDLD